MDDKIPPSEKRKEPTTNSFPAWENILQHHLLFPCEMISEKTRVQKFHTGDASLMGSASVWIKPIFLANQKGALPRSG